MVFLRNINIFASNSGNIQERIHVVQGRRIPLRTIRKMTLAKFEENKIIRPNEGITRHLMVWSDHASILNNGHLLLTVKTLYNPKVFFTDEEMERTGRKVIIEKYLILSIISIIQKLFQLITKCFGNLCLLIH